ncbi:MAG: hypothetical protein ABI811_01555 [Acidobacteriota bacterium]
MKTLAVLLAFTGICAAQNVTEVRIPGTKVFPESITSLNDGTLIIGSLGNGNILRAAPGKAAAEEWIKAGTGGLSTVLGVLADEKSNTLWVCSSKLDEKGDPTSLKAFNLKTGAPKGGYPLPGANPLCNDIAVSEDGTAYVADTRENSVLMLKRGGKALEEVAKDTKLAGADGLAFGQKTTLYVNSVSAGKLFRLDLGADGKAKSIVELTLSRPLAQPDGMRSIGTNRFLLAEGVGRMDLVTIQGNTATMQTLKEGLQNTPAVTATKGMAWVVEGKLNYRNDAKLKDQDPGQFKMYAVPLPK